MAVCLGSPSKLWALWVRTGIILLCDLHSALSKVCLNPRFGDWLTSFQNQEDKGRAAWSEVNSIGHPVNRTLQRSPRPAPAFSQISRRGAAVSPEGLQGRSICFSQEVLNFWFCPLKILLESLSSPRSCLLNVPDHNGLWPVREANLRKKQCIGGKAEPGLVSVLELPHLPAPVLPL